MSVAMLALRDLVLWDYRVAADIEQQRGSTVVARPFLTGRVARRITIARFSCARSRGDLLPRPVSRGSCDIRRRPSTARQSRRSCPSRWGLACSIGMPLHRRVGLPLGSSRENLLLNPRSSRARKQARKRSRFREPYDFAVYIERASIRAVGIPAVVRQSPEHG